MRNLLAFLLFVPCTLLSQLPDYVADNGLMIWYSMDGSGSNAVSSQFNLNLGNISFGADRFGNPESALWLTTDDQMATTSIFEFPASEFSVAIWCKLETPFTYGAYSWVEYGQQLIGQSGSSGWNVGIDSANLYTHYFYTSGSAGGCASAGGPISPAEAGEWHHLVAVHDGISNKFYLNGTRIVSVACNGSSNFNFVNNELRIGNRDNASPGAQRLVDEFGLWNRALDSAEVVALYIGTPPEYGCTDPAACNYDVTAEDDDGSCLYPPSGNLGEAVALCHDGGTLDAGPGFSNYAWSTGADTQMIDVFEEGEYSVTTTFGGAPPNASSVELEGTGGALESAIQTTDSLTDATWMGWFWFDDLDAPQGLLAQNNGYNTNGYYINTNPFFDTATSTGGSSNSAIWFSSPVGSTNQNAQSWTQADAILPMTWHHIAVVLENGLIHIHVDGIAATMHNSFNEDWLALYDVDQHVVEASDAPFRLGSGTDINGNVDQVMRGKMDGLSLWNRALTQDEIQGYMNCPPSSGSAGIQALWTFEDPSPLEDQSGQGHNATLASGQIVSEAPVSICPSCTTQNTALVVHMECEGLCGDGTVWDSSLGTCVSICEDPQGQCGEGTVWDSTLNECVGVFAPADTVFIEPEACAPSCGEGTVWDPVNEECIVAIPADLNYDGCVTVNDLLVLLAVHGTCPPYPEWPEEPTDTTWTCGDPVTYWDYDYATVLIGDQCWFAENLRTLKYRSGSLIPNHLTDSDWDETTEGACSTYGDPAFTCSQYVPEYNACLDSVSVVNHLGRLYNHFAVTHSDSLCPPNWSIPTQTDWNELKLVANQTGIVSGIALKDSIGWRQDPLSEDGLNLIGFNGNAGGKRVYSGGFQDAGWSGNWWTSEDDFCPGCAYARRLQYNIAVLDSATGDKNNGFSVRCIKD